MPPMPLPLPLLRMPILVDALVVVATLQWRWVVLASAGRIAVAVAVAVGRWYDEDCLESAWMGVFIAMAEDESAPFLPLLLLDTPEPDEEDILAKKLPPPTVVASCGNGLTSPLAADDLLAPLLLPVVVG